MTELTADIVVKRIAVNELVLVTGLFNSYRMFYKQVSDVALAETFINERLSNNESVIFVAMDGDQPVGFTQLYPKYSSLRAVKNWILNDLYVAESHRKAGIGGQLIKTVIDFAKAGQSKFVQLETAVDNYTAQSLYESVGFVKQGPDNDFFVYKVNID